MRVVAVLTAVLCGTLVFSGCSAAGEPGPPRLRAQVLASYPHDHTAFTQGLEIADGVLYEGTGLAGSSTLREVDRDTGQVRRQVPVPNGFFGEGITVAGDVIWQLTWQDGYVLRWNRADLTQRDQIALEGEGWGLCRDGERLIMSDGTGTLSFRDPKTFARTGTVTVRRAGAEVSRLNELECVNGSVYANVWQTEEILRIDPNSGAVTAVVDASGLLRPEQKEGTDVLNGIAAIPGTEEFLLTGKLWPAMFRVKFEPVRQD